MKVKLKLSEGAKVPTYGTPGAACFDIYATSVKRVWDNVYEYSTGLFFEIPEGYALMIYSRSGQGFKYQTRLSNAVGVLDSDYRGELKIQLFEDTVVCTENEFPERFPALDFTKAIAQGMIIPVDKVQFDIVDKLSETVRADGGFGSTDMKGNT
jgi:dUTP pyrophosphatase